MRVFVDANVFLRFLVDDDPRQSRQAERLLHSAAEGRLELWCGPPVLFELAWTLRSAYGQTRAQVLNALKGLLALKGLKLADAGMASKAVEMAQEHNMEFADAYIAAQVAAEKGQLATFNTRDFVHSGVKLLSLLEKP